MQNIMKLLIITQKVDEQDEVLGFMHRWIGEFARRCEAVVVICLEEGTHHLPQNVKVLSLGKEKNPSRIRYILRFWYFIWHERNAYDVVFVHMNQVYVVLGWLAWRVLGKKIKQPLKKFDPITGSEVQKCGLSGRGLIRIILYR